MTSRAQRNYALFMMNLARSDNVYPTSSTASTIKRMKDMKAILAVLLKANLGISSLLGNPIIIIVAVLVLLSILIVVISLFRGGGKSRKW